VAHGRLVAFTTVSGDAVYQGLVSDKGFVEQPTGLVPENLDPFKAADSADADQRLWALTYAYARDHPGEALLAVGRNLLYFISPVRYKVWLGEKFGLENAVSLVYYGICYVAAAAALIIHRRRPEVWLVVIVFGGMILYHALPLGTPRYRVPFDCLAIVLAGGLVQHWYDRRGGCASACRGRKASRSLTEP
jgi:hypothetical protein